MLKATDAWISSITRTHFSVTTKIRRSASCLCAASITSIDSVTLTGQEHPDPIPANAFTALNLATFLFHLKSYACTKRGEQSILALIPSTSSAGERRREGQKQSLFGSNRPLQRKQRYAAAGSRSSTRSKKVNGYHYHALPIAKSAEDCVNEYKLVQEAMDLLNFHNNGSTGKDVLLPPIFKLSDGDTGSDEDGWVEACMSSQLDIYQEIDLETILQAECLVKLLLDTHDWAKESPYSGLVGVVSEMDGCAKHLSKLYHTLNSSSTSSETIGEMNIAPSLLTFRETFKFLSTFFRTPSYFLCYTFPIRLPKVASTCWVRVHRSILVEIFNLLSAPIRKFTFTCSLWSLILKDYTCKFVIIIQDKVRMLENKLITPSCCFNRTFGLFNQFEIGQISESC